MTIAQHPQHPCGRLKPDEVVQEPRGRDATEDLLAFETPCTLRRASAADTPAIEAMFTRCSAQSRQWRFFRPVVSTPHGYLDEVLADHDNHHGFLVQRDGTTIGFAELHLTDHETAALALIVEDRYHRRGVGTAALHGLMQHACGLGLHRLTADVQFENARVLRGLHRAAPTSVHFMDGIFHAELDLRAAGYDAPTGRVGSSETTEVPGVVVRPL